MYFLLTGKLLSVVPWIVALIFWSLGGWLLSIHAFNLEKRGRFLVGSGLGLVLYVWLVNVLGHFLIPWLAFSIPAILVFAIGVLYAWKSENPFFSWEDLSEWRIMLVFLVIVYVELQIGRGLGIFDDRKNISIIALMAKGDIPPHFYMNPTVSWDYHYGFQLFSASLVRLGGLFPWSAFDLGKAIMVAFTLILVYLLGMRYTRNQNAAVLITVVFTFATGTIYLLNLAPMPILERLNWNLRLVGPDPVVGMRFSDALRKIVGPNDTMPPFLFSYMNGITSWPFIMSQAGPNAFGWLIIVLVWLLAARSEKKGNFWIFAVLFSMLALAWEVSYVLVGIGGVGIFVLYRIFPKKTRMTLFWGLLASAPIVLIQGGTLSGFLFSIIEDGASGGIGNEGNPLGFILQWPPAIYSSRLGFLRIYSPVEMLAATMAIGPVLFFVPWIIWWGWKNFKEGDWMVGALTLSSLVGFVLPMFLVYHRAHDTVRIMAYSVRVWTLLLSLLISEHKKLWAKQFKQLAVIGLALMVFGGVVIGGSAITAASQPILADQIHEMDAQTARDNWGKLEEGDVFDSHSWRTVPLFGRATRASLDSFTSDPEWKDLRDSPRISKLKESGYRYVYIDEEWWGSLLPKIKNEFTADCVKVVSEYDDGEDFRRLIDIDNCEY